METGPPSNDFSEVSWVPVGSQEKASPLLQEGLTGQGCDASQETASLAETCGVSKISLAFKQAGAWV